MKKIPPGCSSGIVYRSRYFDFALQIFKGFPFLALGCFCIDVHGGADVGMAHDVLNDLDIGFILTEPGAERVPQIMNREVRDHHRFTMFCRGAGLFPFIASRAYPINRPVDRVGCMQKMKFV